MSKPNDHDLIAIEKANIIPVHKKSINQIMKNYRPVPLLPISCKILKKNTFNCSFKYLEDKKLLNCNQSGFQPSDSCVDQLLSITHEIYKSSDTNPSLEVKGFFWTHLKPLIVFGIMTFFIN